MIKLHKQPVPDVLAQNSIVWRGEFLDALESGTATDTQKFRYRHPDVKEALRTETHDKCAYCESKISHIHPGETDHILPSSRKPELYVEWENLTYVCSECNRRKSDYYSEAEPLVNPYSDEPSNHLIFCGPLVLDRDAKGYRTRRKIGLSRTALIERKQERIEQINSLVRQWRETPDGPTREFLKAEIQQFATVDAEFAATAQAYLANELGWDINITAAAPSA